MRIERILFTGGKTHLQPKGVSESGNSTTATLQCMHRKFVREGKIEREDGDPPQSMRDTVTVRNVIRENCERRDGGTFRKAIWSMNEIGVYDIGNCKTRR